MRTPEFILRTAMRQIARYYGQTLADVVRVEVEDGRAFIDFTDGTYDTWEWVENPDPARQQEAPCVWKLVAASQPLPEDPDREAYETPEVPEESDLEAVHGFPVNFALSKGESDLEPALR
jgi:hypothetical protein